MFKGRSCCWFSGCAAAARAAGLSCQASHKASAINGPLKSQSHHHSLRQASPWAASTKGFGKRKVLKPTWLVCKVFRTRCSLQRVPPKGGLGLIHALMHGRATSWRMMCTSGHQSPVTGTGSRRYDLNISQPEEDQSYGTSTTTPSPQGPVPNYLE